jgi:outer membrane protein assembly factor BamB
LTGESATAEGHGRNRQIALIVFSLTAAVTVLFLIAGKRPSRMHGDDEGILQITALEPDEDSLPADSVSSPERGGDPPILWTQPRGTAGGNASWGDPVLAPFDTLWRLETGFEFFSAPALCDGRFYFGCNDGRFRCVDAASGSTVWSYSITCGMCGEAAVDSQRVYFGGQDGYVYALDRDSGSLDWSAGLGYHVFADVAILADTLVVTGNSVGQIAALDVSDGSVVWDHTPGGLVLGPCVVDSLAVFSTEDGVVAVYDASGRQLWKRDFPAQASAPSAAGDAVFAGFSDGTVRRMDLYSGETEWETDLTSSAGRSLLSRPVVVDSLVLVGSCDSRLLLLDARTGGTIWESRFENWIQVPPVVSDSVVFVTGDDQRLHLLGLSTGAPLDSLEIGGYSGTAPLFLDGMLVFGTASGEFFALEGTVPEPPEEPAGQEENTE